MANPSPAKIALIGLGYWGKNHLRTFTALSEAQLVRCCDLAEANLEPLRRSHPTCKLSTNPKEVFGDPDVQGVVIATTSPSHHGLAK